MGFFQQLFTKKQIDSRILGVWETDPDDAQTLRNFGKNRMTFSSDGRLVYDAFVGIKIQRMNLVFYTENGWIISNQPSHPREERTKYYFDGASKLIVELGGDKAKYIRVSAH